MKKKIAGLVVVALGAVALSASAAGEEPQEWSLENCVDAAGNATTKVTSDTRCELKNHKNSQCLYRTGHMGQTDWDFGACDKHPKSVSFQKEGGGDIKCGDAVAMKLGSEWFRKCQNPQTVGINICSDGKGPAKNHYDWQLRCAGDVEQGKKVALFNVSKSDSIVFAKRPSRVVDTCWADKTKLGQCTSIRDK